MARTKNYKVKGFLLSFIGDNSERVFLKFVHDHHAEQVLRGLVHSGYEVTLSEEIMDMPERLKAVSDFQDGTDYQSMQPVPAIGFE